MLIVFGLLTACAGVGSDMVDAETTTPTPYASGTGFTVERTPDATRCGGVAVRVVRDAGVPMATADRPLAEFLAVTYPLGLDFGDATREASLNTFNRWLIAAQHRAQTAVDAYSAQLTTATEPGAQAAATARLVQVSRWFADLLVHAEIPIDMRHGEFAEDQRHAFCDKLAKAAEPLLARADRY